MHRVEKNGVGLLFKFAKLSLMPPSLRVVMVLFVSAVTGAAGLMGAPGRSQDELRKEVHRFAGLRQNDVQREIALFVDNATLEEVVQIHRILDGERNWGTTEILYRHLFLRWGMLDGPAALRAASSNRSSARARYEGDAAAGWAHYDPKQAWKEILAVSNGRTAAGGVPSHALYVIAEHDLELALTFYEDLPPSRTCLECNAGNICLAAARQGKYETVFAALDRMKRGPARNALRDRFWSTLGQVMAGDAFEWLDRMKTEEDRNAARIKAYVGWADADSETALDQVLHIGDATLFENTLLAVVQVWGRRARSEEVTRFLRRLPQDLSERSTLGLAAHLAQADAPTTLAWIETFSEASIRNEAMARTIRVWSQLDSDAARDYIRRIDDLEVRGALLANYLLTKLKNKTLQPQDFEEIASAFSKEWTKRLLRQIGTNLMNPSINDTQFFDLEAFVAFVKNRPNWTDADRAPVLASIGR